MDRATVVLITLIVYKVVLITIGLLSRGRNKDAADFYLGGRQLGSWVAALSASASSSSAWTLLGVSGAAYAWGLSALWLLPACIGGFLLNWCLVAPRLRRRAHAGGALTVTELLAGKEGSPYRSAIAYTASAIIMFSFLFYVAAQFQASGKTFQSAFGMSFTGSILLGGAIIVFYTMVGGFWAVSLTDALQGLVMAATAVVLPIGALLALGGPGALLEAMAQVSVAGYTDLAGVRSGPVAVGFVIGLLGIGLGYPGQPHVVNRFMALKDERALRNGRVIAICWAVLVYSGMLLLGWCGRVLYAAVADKEQIFLHVAGDLFHPVIGGIMIAGVLSATMSTADSQLLVASSSVTNDLPMFRRRNTVFHSRLVVVLLSAGAIGVALLGNAEIFGRVLFAWTAIGAAFGPLLLITLFGGEIAKGHTLAAMIAGFLLSVIAYSFPETKGTFWERVLPFVVATAIGYFGLERNAAGRVDATE